MRRIWRRLVLLILGDGGFDEDHKTDSCYHGRKVAIKHLKDLAKNNLRGLTRRIGTHEQTLFVNRLRTGG